MIEGGPIAAPNDILIDRSWTRAAGTQVGDTLALPFGFQTRDFTVAGIVDQGYFFFQPAMYIDLASWQELNFPGDTTQRPAASLVLLQGRALDGARGERWRIVTKQDGFNNIEGVQAQQSTVDALLSEVHLRDKACIMVTHDDRMARRADRRVEIRDGRVLSDGALPGR